ncbi:Gar1/Naf1 RNA binding region-domain-containing protein [Aspergillus multicolor]|uniref:RNA-binding snoRNP assembly protein NAF1 n=1 Tax=Aspergillus multicolor TaxID=41759 RepID=UPI003CCDC108
MLTEAPISPNPPPMIPGLSLVNDGLNQNQTSQNPGANENSNTADAMIISTETTKETQPATVQNGSETKIEEKPEPAVGGTDAMEVEQELKQPQGESGVDGEVESNHAATGTSGTENATAEGAAAGQAEQEEEEHPEWELDSDPYESSSDSSDSDSSDDSDEDEDYPILSPEEQARILMQGELGSDDEGDGKGKAGAPLKTANEVVEECLPIPDITVTPEMKIVLLGNVEAVVENTVLIAANVTGEYQVLESGSLLCLEDRRIAGVVSETLGRVENPLYTVRFPTTAEVEERGLSKGAVVYYVVDHSTFVFTQPLKGLKGSDASNFHDEEVAEDEVEFSDDEQEAEYRRKLKQKRQERKSKNQDGGPKAARGPPGPSKLSHSELNYDDNEDGYTPLARPKNLHEMMRQEAPVENDGFNRNPGFGGRGRGRGGRGRGRGGRDQGHQSHHDRQPYQQQERSDAQSQSQPQSQPQPQHHQPQPYPAFNPQQYPAYSSLPQQPQQQQPYPQAALPTAPFNFQMPYQQAYQQPNPYQQMSPTPHINPLFLAALQQQQQAQQYQQVQAQAQAQAQAQPQQQQPGAGQSQQNQAMNFDQVKAQLDLLRQLSNGQNQWPPRQ